MKPEQVISQTHRSAIKDGVGPVDACHPYGLVLPEDESCLAPTATGSDSLVEPEPGPKKRPAAEQRTVQVPSNETDNSRTENTLAGPHQITPVRLNEIEKTTFLEEEELKSSEPLNYLDKLVREKSNVPLVLRGKELRHVLRNNIVIRGVEGTGTKMEVDIGTMIRRPLKVRFNPDERIATEGVLFGVFHKDALSEFTKKMAKAIYDQEIIRKLLERGGLTPAQFCEAKRRFVSATLNLIRGRLGLNYHLLWINAKGWRPEPTFEEMVREMEETPLFKRMREEEERWALENRFKGQQPSLPGEDLRKRREGKVRRRKGLKGVIYSQPVAAAVREAPQKDKTKISVFVPDGVRIALRVAPKAIASVAVVGILAGCETTIGSNIEIKVTSMPTEKPITTGSAATATVAELTETTEPMPTQAPTETPIPTVAVVEATLTPSPVAIEYGGPGTETLFPFNDENGVEHRALICSIPTIKNGERTGEMRYSNGLLEIPFPEDDPRVSRDEDGWGWYVDFGKQGRFFFPSFFNYKRGLPSITYEDGKWWGRFTKGDGKGGFESRLVLLEDFAIPVESGQKVVFADGYYYVVDEQGNQVGERVRAFAEEAKWPPPLTPKVLGELVDWNANRLEVVFDRDAGLFKLWLWENDEKAHGKIVESLKWDADSREWVEVELPTSTPEPTPTPSSVYVEYETPENKTISIAEDGSNILNFDGSPYTGGDLPGGDVVVLVVGEKTINGVTYYVFETPYGKKLIEIPGQGPATPTPEPVPSYPTVDTSRHFENTQFLTGEWGREGARTSIPIDPSGFEGYFDGIGTGYNIVTHVVQIIDAENGVLLVDGGELGRFRVQLPPQGSDNKIGEPWGRVIRISPNGRRTTTIRLLDDFGVGPNGDIRVGDWLGFYPRWLDVLKMNKTDQRDERIKATRRHIQEWHAQEGGDGVIPLGIFAICR